MAIHLLPLAKLALMTGKATWAYGNFICVYEAFLASYANCSSWLFCRTAYAANTYATVGTGCVCHAVAFATLNCIVGWNLLAACRATHF